MRKAVVAFFLVFLSLSGVYAQGSSQASLRATKSAEIKDRQAAVREKIEQRRAEIKSRIELRREKIATRVAEVKRRIAERRKALIRRFFSRMLVRFNAAINRMKRIADRIEGRLGKMAARGIEVADLRDDLQEARDNIAVAEGLLGGLEERLEEALASDEPKAAFEEVRDTIHETRDLLKEIHQQLVAIITQMKAALAEAAVEATPSAEDDE
jgi:predicted transcriptional regulator